jgi:hypothetical protein
MPQHVLDRITLGGIVSVRDRLLVVQAKGRKVYRLESGDPSFSIPTTSRPPWSGRWRRATPITRPARASGRCARPSSASW